MERNVFECGRALVPSTSLESTSSTAQAQEESRIQFLVKLVESKGQYSQCQRQICSLQDHMSVQALADASSMRDSKQSLDHATATLQVRTEPSSRFD